MNVLVIMMALGGAPSFHAGHAWSAPNCVSALEQAYKPFAARKSAEASGDFNSDGQPDFAMLLDNARTPAISAIGICLSNESRPLLITAPYQTVEIFTKPKGTAYEDYETRLKARTTETSFRSVTAPGSGRATFSALGYL